MMVSKDVRSPAGQKLIRDLMLGDEDSEVAGVCAEAADAEEPAHPASRQFSPRCSSESSYAANEYQRRTSLPITRNPFDPAKGAHFTDADTDPDTSRPSDRPATAPAASTTLIVPPQLPAARSTREPRNYTISPILERHLVSRHTSAYLGVVTAVLHQVSSPAATGAPRDTQRRPGTVPRDVYHHSDISHPNRHRLASLPVQEAGTGAGAMDRMYSSGSGGTLKGEDLARNRLLFSSRIPPIEESQPSSYPPLNTRGLEGPAGGYDFMMQGTDAVEGQQLYAPFSPSGLARHGGSGDYYMPYLDRSYGSHAPLACAVDSLARRAEAHKALTRQSLLQKHLEQQVAAAGRRGALNNAQPQQQQQQQQVKQQGQRQQPQRQGPAQFMLARTSHNEPYDLRLEGGITARSLGLSWDTSPGVVAAAAAAAATTVAAIAARAEGLPAASSPLLRDSTLSPNLRDVGSSPANKTSSRPLQVGGAAASGGQPSASQPRRVAGDGPVLSGPGCSTPAGAPKSPIKRLGRGPQTAVEATALAAEAEETARSQLPSALRRAYNGALAAQTVQDWETISEPNRRMMQAIENVTMLVGRGPSRHTARQHAASSVGGGGGRVRAGAKPSAGGPPGSGAMKRRGGVAGGGGGTAVGEEGLDTGGDHGGGVPFGRNTSSRSRRRYIRYSVDVFPELGLPPKRQGGLTATTTDTSGPFGVAAVAAAAQSTSTSAAPSSPLLSNLWSPRSMADSTAVGGDVGLWLEPTMSQVYEHDSGEPYGSGEYTSGPYGSTAARGPRYLHAAAARVPVPVYVHPLPTPPAAVAAIVAGGGIAAATAASLPHWIDPLTAATSNGGGDFEPLNCLQSSPSSGSATTLPAVSSGSHGSLGGGGRTQSRMLSSVTSGISARGFGLQGHPSGPPQASLSTVTDDTSGSWSAAGSGSPALATRNSFISRRNVQHTTPNYGGKASHYPEGAEEAYFGGGGVQPGDSPQSVSPQSSRYDASAADASPAAAVAGRASPAVEFSLLPLGPTSHAAPSSRHGSSILLSAESTEMGFGACKLSGPATGWGGVDAAGFQLGVGTSSRSHSLDSRTSGSRVLDAASSSASSRMGPARTSRLLETREEEEEDEGFDDESEGEEEDDGWQEEAKDMVIGGVGRAMDGLGIVNDDGWSFPEGALGTGATSGTGIAVAAPPPEAAAAGSIEWDAGPTPRLVSRLAAGGDLPLAYDRMQPTSATSDTVSASVGNSWLRNPAMAVTRPLSVLDDGSTVRASSSQESVSRFAPSTSALHLDSGQGGSGGAYVRDSALRDISPARDASMAAAPQGPVLTHGTSYRVVTSVAASLISEDPREAARMMAQREVDAQLERSSEHTGKLKMATRATKALARAGSMAMQPLPSTAGASQAGYVITQPRTVSRIGFAPVDEGTHGSLSVRNAPVPAPAEMEAMASAARALLAAPPTVTASRLARHGAADRDRSPHKSLDPGSYQHIHTTIDAGRTAQMQDLWAQ